jgi:hypothetical protein
MRRFQRSISQTLTLSLSKGEDNKETPMKLSSILCASIVALAASALIADGALATGPKTANGTKSNTFKLDSSNPDAEKDCNKQGGTVKEGMCVMPSSGGEPAAATTLSSSKSNQNDKTGNPEPASGPSPR